MLTVVNFANPTIPEIQSPVLGVSPDEIRFIEVPVRGGYWREMADYAAFLVQEGVDEAGGNAMNIDAIIPPTHGAVAAAVVAQFAREHHYIPNIIIIRHTVPSLTVPDSLVRGERITPRPVA